ncbi:MAG: sigma 54-interacting transcriptional regulator, partial [Victivallales bacterium]|nr:sigma 54-interacting transcriptional regulator [Victivallales bacterium]
MLIRVKIAVSHAELKDMIIKQTEHLEMVPVVAGSADNIRQLAVEPADVLIISEDNIPAPQHESLRVLMQLPEPPSIMVLSSGSRMNQTAMLALGCEAVLSLEVPLKNICKALASLLKKYQERHRKISTAASQFSEPRLSDFVSQSRSMQVFLNTVRKIVNCNSSLLILGETGVGKERLALAIHNEHRRRNSPFIAVNCAALPETLLESELFGHEKGAFTGASRSRRGAFEMAHTGTLFLDEIGDMPMHLQIKLLRAIQEKQFLKIGGENMVSVDVRIMAATNRDLVQTVEQGNFRKDLFYRLSVISLTIPPLSERREDIPELVNNYINYLAPRVGVNVNAIDAAAMELLVNYKWPGNVRELINVVERALLLCDGDTITTVEIPDNIIGDKTKTISDLPAAVNCLAADWTSLPWKTVKNKIRDAVES